MLFASFIPTSIDPIALIGSITKNFDSSCIFRKNSEFAPYYKNIYHKECIEYIKYIKYMLTISESITVMFKLGKGVPGAIFSGIETK